MAKGPLNYGYQPLQGPGSFNYQTPTNMVDANQAFSGILPGVGGQYLDSMSQYGSPVAQQGWGFNQGTFQNVMQGAGALGTLAQIYGMFQNLGLQKKAFKFAQEGTKRNFNAQATAFNENVASKETARHAYAAASGQDYNSIYSYGTGQKVEKWT